MKKTIQQLLKENSVFYEDNRRWEMKDERIRKEFADLLHLGYLPKTPSWEIIFAEIGKLVGQNNYENLQNQLTVARQELRELREVKKDN